jgi:putative solute:sodium symporter small subunit
MADRRITGPEAEAAHWEVTSRLALTVVVALLLLVLGIGFGGAALDVMTVLGLPLGYVMAGVGGPVLLLLLLIAHDGRQQTIDERYGAAEE